MTSASTRADGSWFPASSTAIRISRSPAGGRTRSKSEYAGARTWKWRRRVAESPGRSPRRASASSEALVDRCCGWLSAMAQPGRHDGRSQERLRTGHRERVRLLEVYETLRRTQPVRIVSTLLAAHVVPPEYAAVAGEYVEMVCRELIPAVARRGARPLLRRVRGGVGVHAAGSADDSPLCARARTWREASRRPVHRRRRGRARGGTGRGIRGSPRVRVGRMASRGSLAPGPSPSRFLLAALYLGRPAAPARSLIAAGVPVAVATDFNPGTAPTFHLPLAMLLAATLQRMTPAEVLKAATIYAARAIGEASVTRVARTRQARRLRRHRRARRERTGSITSRRMAASVRISAGSGFTEQSCRGALTSMCCGMLEVHLSARLSLR